MWIGFDEKKPLGENETGGQAALPVWMDFMRVALADPARKNEAFLSVNEGNKKKGTKKIAAYVPGRAASREGH